MAKQCSRCGKPAQEGEFCDSCFPDIIGKRIRKGFKIDLKKDMKILVLDKLSEAVVKDILQGAKVKIINKTLKDFDIKALDNSIYLNEKLDSYVNDNKIDIIILPWTADDEIDKFFIGLFNKQIDKNNKDSRFIKLFRSITNEELARYAKLKKIKLETVGKTNEFIRKLAEKYPEIKHSTLKSIEQLNDIR